MEEGEASVSSCALPSAIDGADKVPVVKAKATHVIMSSLITSKHSALSELGAGKSLGFLQLAGGVVQTHLP